MDPAGWLPFLQEIADRADGIALRRFGSRDLRVEGKADLSPVTEADRAIEETARKLASRRRPGLGVCGEEYGESSGSGETRLIVDPIDGTRNFVRGIPIFATLLAVEEAGEVVAGLVSAPALRLRWAAARGSGARREGKLLRVSAIRELEQALLFHSSVGGREEVPPPEGFERLARRVRRTRGFGDFYQHVLVAEGCGEIALDPVVKPWDIAPLQVIVEEAGGRATTLQGRRTIDGGSLVTSNGLLHDEALAILS